MKTLRSISADVSPKQFTIRGSKAGLRLPLVGSPASALSSYHLSPSLGASARLSGFLCFIFESSFVFRPGCLWSGLRPPLLYLQTSFFSQPGAFHHFFCCIFEPFVSHSKPSFQHPFIFHLYSGKNKRGAFKQETA